MRNPRTWSWQRLALSCLLSFCLAGPFACIQAGDSAVATAANATVTAEPNQLAFDASATARIELVLRDVAGNLLAMRTATLRCDDANAELTQPGPTDGQGRSTGGLRARAPGTFVVHASYADAGGQIEVLPPAVVAFVARDAGPQADANATSVPPSLRLAVAGKAAVADGNHALAVSVAVLRSDGTPFAGAQVTLAGAHTRDAASPTAGVTGADGTFSAELRSTLSGARTLTARVAGARAQASYAFVAGPPDLGRSFLRLLADGVSGDGQGDVPVQVVLRDAFDNPVVGEPVALRSSSPNVVFVPPMGTSDADGTLAVTMRSTAVGVVPVVASLPDREPPAAVTPGQPNASFGLQVQGNATFVVGPPAAANSALELVQPGAVTVADGRSVAALRVRLRDAADHPVVGATVAIVAPPSPADGAPSPLQLSVDGNVTAADGTLTLAVASTGVGTLPLLATAQNLTLAAGVPFVAGAADAGRSSLSPAAQAVVADGVALARFVVQVQDALGHPVVGQAVAMAAYPAGPTFVPSSGDTDASGLFVATLRSTRAEATIVTATAGGVNVAANVTFVPGSPNVTASRLVAAPPSGVAGGNVQLTTTVRDAFGNAIANANVALLSGDVADVLTPTGGVSDATGQLTTQLASTHAGGRTLTARIAGAASLTLPVTFVAAPPVAAGSSLSISPNLVATNGNVATVVARFVDAYGNPTAGQNVTFTSSGTDVAYAPGAQAVTDASGRANVGLSSATPQDLAVQATATTSGAALGASLSFYGAGAPWAANSNFVVTGSPVVANSNAQFTAALNLRDRAAAPVVGAQSSVYAAQLTATPARTTLTTDASGQASWSVGSQLAGTKRFVARAGGLLLQAFGTAGQNPAACGTGLVLGGLVPSLPTPPVANVELSDLDQDGVPDLLYVAPDGLYVYRGLSNGAYARVAQATQASLVAATASGQPRVVDVNGDGNVDVVALLQKSGQWSLQMFLGEGGGNFVAAAPIATGGLSTYGHVVAADLDNDGLVDILSASYTDNATSLWTYYQQAGGSFLLQKFGAGGTGFSTGVKLGDFDEDGRLDVAYRHDGYFVQVMLATGARVYVAGPNVNLGFTGHDVADIDADGHLDLLSIGEGQTRVSWGTGNGNFSYQSAWSLPSRYNGLASPPRDLNGDGLPEIFSGSGSNAGFSILVNLGNRNFSAPRTYAAYGTSITDLVQSAGATQAGRPQLLVRTDFALTPLFIDAGGNVQLPARVVLGATGATRARPVALVNVDADATFDLVTVTGDGTLAVALGGGNNGFGAVQTLAGAPNQAAFVAADLDQDGKLDLWTADAGAATAGFYRGLGTGAFAARVDVALPAAFADVVAVDVNGDGLLDLAGVAPGRNSVYVALGAGGGNFAPFAAYPVGANPTRLRPADLAGFGNVDLLVAQTGGNSVGVLLGNGLGGFGAATSYPAGPAPLEVAALDVNGDGNQDVLVASGTTASVQVLLGSGTGALAAATGYPVDAVPTALLVGDVDGDGTVDWALAQPSLNGVFVARNGDTAAPLRLALGAAVGGLALADLNADGRADLVAVDGQGGAASVLLGGACPSATVGGAPSSALSRLSVASSAAVVGQNVLLTASVLDANGNTVPGQSVAFASNNGNDLLSPTSSVTNASGVASFTLRNTVAGPRAVTATAGAASFGATVTLVAGSPNATYSSLTASPSTQVANNAGAVTVTTLLGDAYGNPVRNVTVTLGTSNASGNDTFAPSSGLTNAAGVFTASWCSTKAEAKAVTASASTVTKVANATFVPGPSSVARSTLVAAPSAVPATGFYPSTLTLTARDAFGNPLPQQSFFVRSSGTSVRLPVAGTLVTDANARALAVASSKAAQNANVFVPLADGNLTAVVAFTPPTPLGPAQSSFVVTPAQDLVADGNTPALATFVAKDASGNALPYVGVSLQSPTNNLRLVPAFGATDANGSFVAKVTSQVSGKATLWAASGNARLSQALTYLPKANTCTRPLMMGGAPPAASTVGNNHVMAVRADVDQDGNDDVVYGGSSVSGVAWGNGDGTFSSTTSIGVGNNVFQVGVVDLDGDGRLDIIQAIPHGQEVAYWLGLGNRAFDAGHHLNLESTPYGVLAQDFDHDGLVDLAYINNATNTVNIWRATAPLSWTRVQSLATGNGPNRIYAADFNKDGFSDLVVLNGGGVSSVSVFLSAAGGNFLAGTNYDVGIQGPYYAAIGDVTADGNLDVVVTASGQFSFSTLVGLGNGTFTAAKLTPTAAALASISLGDVDKDGALDVVVGTINNARTYRGNKSGNFVAAAPVGLSDVVSSSQQAGFPALLADLTRDGNLDYVALSADNSRLFVLPGRGDGTFVYGSPTGYLAGPSPAHVVSADMDGDGKLDLVVANDRQQLATLLKGMGDGSFVATKTYAISGAYGVSSVAVADLNVDGILDLVVTDATNSGSQTSLIEVFLGLGGGNLAAPVSYTVGNKTQSCAASDVNADGVPDLSCASYFANTVSILLGDGTGRFLSPINSLSVAAPTRVTFADVDNDGNVDVLASSCAGANGKLWVLRNGGSGAFSTASSLSLPYCLLSVLARDFTADGNVDAVTVTSSAPLGLARGTGAGTFGANGIAGQQRSDWPPEAADFDGDGKLDFANVDQLMLGNGDGTFRGPRVYALPNGASATAVGDFNGDGLIDYVVTSYSGNSAYVYLNGGCGAPVATGTPSPANTVLSLSPNLAVADNANAITARVQVRDGNGLPVANVGVVWATDGGNNVFLPATGVTDANGILATLVRSTRAQVENVQAVVAGRYVLAAPATFVAGAPNATISNFAVAPSLVLLPGNAVATAQVKDAFGNACGNLTVTFSSDANAQPASQVVGSDANGRAVATLRYADTAFAAATVTAVVGGATLTGSAALAPDRLSFGVGDPVSVPAGVPVSFTLTATDGNGNVDASYRGQVAFTSTDAQASLPANYTFTAGDAGVHAFSGAARFRTAGNVTLSANDVLHPNVTASTPTSTVLQPVLAPVALHPSAATAALCLEPLNQAVGTNAPLVSLPCRGALGQVFFAGSDDTLRVLHQCLQATGSAGGQPTLTACNGSLRQRWTVDANGWQASDGSCLDGLSASNTAGALTTTCGNANAAALAAQATSEWFLPFNADGSGTMNSDADLYAPGNRIATYVYLTQPSLRWSAAAELRSFNQMCLAPSGGVPSAGAAVTWAACSGASAQRWAVTGPSLRPVAAPNLCVDRTSWALATCAASQSQNFLWQQTSNLYQLRQNFAGVSPRCVGQAGTLGSMGQQYLAGPCADASASAPNQTFTPRRNPNATRGIYLANPTPASINATVMDTYADGPPAGTTINSYSPQANVRQSWKVQGLSASSVVQLQSNAGGNLCLDVSGGSAALQACTGGNGQTLAMVPQGMQISPQSIPSLCFAAAGGNAFWNSTISLQACQPVAAQQFFQPWPGQQQAVSGGTVTYWTPITLGGLCLDVASNSNVANALVLTACAETPTQLWSQLPDRVSLSNAANQCAAYTTGAAGGVAYAAGCTGDANQNYLVTPF